MSGASDTLALRGVWLGRRAYDVVHRLQQRWQQARRAGAAPDVCFFLEHEPVVTLGRGAHEEHLLLPRPELERRGFAVEESGRGGDVTVHAPGQLIGYPIVDLSRRPDVRRYVNDLTETMRRVAADHGVAAGKFDGHVGLWADVARPSVWTSAAEASELAKLGAIGVRFSRWVTMHGFALNLTTELARFDVIVPCGIREHGVTSIRALNGREPRVEEAAARAHAYLCEALGVLAGPFEDASAEPDRVLDAWPR